MNYKFEILTLLSTIALFPFVNCIPVTKSSSIDVPLVTFDGADSTTFKFHALNDPVMGGVSVGSWELDDVNGVGIFNGTVKDVPALSAPGFLSAYAKGDFNDASMAISGDLVLKVRTSTPEYTGFRVSFAAGTLSPLYACSNGGVAPLSNGCYKSRFEVPAGDEFVEIRVPFSSFSDHWNPATGDQTITCADDPSVCPTEKALSQIRWIEVWAEGVGGDIHLELESISASDNTPSSNLIPKIPYISNSYLSNNPSASKDDFDVDILLTIMSKKLPYVPTPYLPTPNEPYKSKHNSHKESSTNIIPNLPYIPTPYLPTPNDHSAPKDDFDVEELLEIISNKLPYIPTPYLPTPNEPYISKKSMSKTTQKQTHIFTPDRTATSDPYIPIVTFDNTPSTTHEFTQLNDPVMGGVSVGTWSINEEEGYGIMNGTVNDVPFLHAPGFIKAASYFRSGSFSDASSAIEGYLILNVRSSTADYTGFRISIAAGTISPEYSCASGGVNPLSGGCFKAKYSVNAGDEFSEVKIPFNMFSDHWSPATGEQTVTCAEDPKVCPTAKDLSDIKSIEIWAEGVKGDVHLEIKSIAAGL